MADGTGLSVKVVDDPLSCVARGTAVYLENLSDWKNTLETDHDNM
jgi:rod shape-determining protein MreB